MMKSAAVILACAAVIGCTAHSGTVAVLSDDPGVNNAPALQHVIDSVSSAGGGRVIVPEGRYMLGTVHLKSGVELYLEEGAVLAGSLNVYEDYSDRAFIFADGACNVTISGKGTIDGGSDSDFYRERFADGTFHNNDGLRPFGIFLKDCRDVRISGISLENAGFWGLRLFRCDGVDIRDISITSLQCMNNDGIDVDARNVHISGCFIRTDDDGICLKSDDKDFPVENIVVENCTIASNCNPIKFGTASYCCFRNVLFRNCTVRSTGETHVWDWSRKYLGIEAGEAVGLSGIAVQSADGADIEDIRFEDISMEGIITPFFLYIGSRKGGPGTMKDISFHNITAVSKGVLPSLICGHRDSKIENISFKGVSISTDGYDGTVPDHVPENETGYPENRMFGKTNPAGVFFIRHADGIMFDDFEFDHRSADARQPFVLDDATNVIVNGTIIK